MIITFLGHRTILKDENLADLVERVILEHTSPAEDVYFYCGGYGAFDAICAGVCRSLKKQRPKSHLVFVTPYLTEAQQKKMNRMVENGEYDSILYPPLESVPYRTAILRRNEWMIEKADLILSYVRYSNGGAYEGLRYAYTRGKSIVNFCESILPL